MKDKLIKVLIIVAIMLSVIAVGAYCYTRHISNKIIAETQSILKSNRAKEKILKSLLTKNICTELTKFTNKNSDDLYKDVVAYVNNYHIDEKTVESADSCVVRDDKTDTDEDNSISKVTLVVDDIMHNGDTSNIYIYFIKEGK